MSQFHDYLVYLPWLTAYLALNLLIFSIVVAFQQALVGTLCVHCEISPVVPLTALPLTPPMCLRSVPRLRENVVRFPVLYLIVTNQGQGQAGVRGMDVSNCGM